MCSEYISTCALHDRPKCKFRVGAIFPVAYDKAGVPWVTTRWATRGGFAEVFLGSCARGSTVRGWVSTGRVFWRGGIKSSRSRERSREDRGGREIESLDLRCSEGKSARLYSNLRSRSSGVCNQQEGGCAVDIGVSVGACCSHPCLTVNKYVGWV